MTPAVDELYDHLSRFWSAHWRILGSPSADLTQDQNSEIGRAVAKIREGISELQETVFHIQHPTLWKTDERNAAREEMAHEITRRNHKLGL